MTHEEGNSTDADNLSSTSILELQKKYGISRTSLYRRMRYLQIKTKKIGGKAYLNAQQVVSMDGLHEYITTNKKMDGYTKPESIKPDLKEKQTIQVVEELTPEIQQAQMAAISTPLSHRADYDPKFLAQLMIQTL